MPFVAGDERAQKALSRSAIVLVVQAQARETAGDAGAAHAALDSLPVARLKACVSEPPKRPLRCGGDHLGDYCLDAVCRGQIQLTIVLLPVVLVRRDLDR